MGWKEKAGWNEIAVKWTCARRDSSLSTSLGTTSCERRSQLCTSCNTSKTCREYADIPLCRGYLASPKHDMETTQVRVGTSKTHLEVKLTDW
jgi:hypothetical protein